MASRDCEEFVAAFNAHGVRYLVVGAHAVALHARPRRRRTSTSWLIRPRRTRAACWPRLREVSGGTHLGYTVDDVVDPRGVIRLGVAPVRIDLMSEIAGFFDFDAAWRQRVDARFGAVATHYIGLDHLIRAKQAADRPQDRADVRILQRARSRARRGRRSGRPAG
jgi:hypothetical protein